MPNTEEDAESSTALVQPKSKPLNASPSDGRWPRIPSITKRQSLRPTDAEGHVSAHTPFYQQPVVEKKVCKKDSDEVTIRIIKKGMISQTSEECKCTCHDNKKVSRSTPVDPRSMAELSLKAAELEAVGWMSIDDAGSPEVLVYIHGYNNTHITVKLIFES